MHLFTNLKRYLVLIALSICACTKVIPGSNPASTLLIKNTIQENKNSGWHAARFTLVWQKDQQPNWYLGTLIAGEVIAPLLQQYENKIKFWRLHRRAVDDETGHVFSFIFYSSNHEAAMIYQNLHAQGLLNHLQQNKQLDKVSYDALAVVSKPDIADTSDPDWPIQIRETWPVFIMGASRMWLDLVLSLKAEIMTEPKFAPVSDYKVIQEKITDLWQQQGQHALFHHLNALYAYQPVLTRF